MEKLEMMCESCGYLQLVSKEDFLDNDEIFCERCDAYIDFVDNDEPFCVFCKR